MDWQAILDAAGAYWSSLPLLQQFLHAGTALLLAAFSLFLWTPLGNRRTAVKCLALAVLLHALAWGFVDQNRFQARGPHRPTQTVRVRIRPWPESPQTATPQRITQLEDPRVHDRPPPDVEDAWRRQEPAAAMERVVAAPEPSPPRPEPTADEMLPAISQTAPLRSSPTPITFSNAAEPKPVTPRSEISVFPEPAESELARSSTISLPEPAREINQQPIEAQVSLPADDRSAIVAPPVVKRSRPRSVVLQRAAEFGTPNQSKGPSQETQRQALPDEPSLRRRPSEASRPRRVIASAAPGDTVGHSTSARIAERGAASDMDLPSTQPLVETIRPRGMIPLAPPPTASDTMSNSSRPGGQTAKTPGQVERRLDNLAGEQTLGRRRSGDDGPVRQRFTGRTASSGDDPVQTLLERTHAGGHAIEPVAALDTPRTLWSQRLAPNRLDIVVQGGGSRETERAVADALAWLVRHQEPDGFWDSDEFFARCPHGDRCSGPAIETGSDTGLTGLALLAFLGAGHTHLESDEYKDTLHRGLHWLTRMQRPDGDLRGQGRIYCHAMATLALTEAYALSGDKQLKRPAQNAIDWLARAQHPHTGGWRYAPGQTGDTSVYGWVLLALRSAQAADLRVPKTTWDRAQRWLPLVSSGPHGGLASYRVGIEVSQAMTAEALVCRQILGMPRTDPAMDEAAAYILQRLPNPKDYHLYYWYYGTLAMFQLGGPSWDRWNDRLTATLLQSQEQTGHRRGSWNPQSPFGVDGGRVFTTACSALCLEVYYRYLPIYAESGKAARKR